MNMPIEGARFPMDFKGIIDKFRGSIEANRLPRRINRSELNGKIVGKRGHIGG
jgi:hypothetical protein